MRIEILVFDGFDELDVFGPFETLSAPGFAVRLVAIAAPTSITSQRGVELRIADAPGDPDVLVVPGGGWLDRRERGAWAEAQRGDVPKEIRRIAETGAVVSSVCTGAFLLGTAGLLEGRDATTNRNALEALEAFAGRVVAERVVDAGSVVTAGGLTAGIDLGLHLLERFAGSAVADRRAAGIEYPRATRTWYADPR